MAAALGLFLIVFFLGLNILRASFLEVMFPYIWMNEMLRAEALETQKKVVAIQAFVVASYNTLERRAISSYPPWSRVCLEAVEILTRKQQSQNDHDLVPAARAE